MPCRGMERMERRCQIHRCFSVCSLLEETLLYSQWIHCSNDFKCYTDYSFPQSLPHTCEGLCIFCSVSRHVHWTLGLRLHCKSIASVFVEIYYNHLSSRGSCGCLVSTLVQLTYCSEQPNNCSAKYKDIQHMHNSLLYWTHANQSIMPDPRVSMHMQEYAHVLKCLLVAHLHNSHIHYSPCIRAWIKLQEQELHHYRTHTHLMCTTVSQRTSTISKGQCGNRSWCEFRACTNDSNSDWWSATLGYRGESNPLAPILQYAVNGQPI